MIPGWAGFRSSLLPLQYGLRRHVGDDVMRADIGSGLGCIRCSAERAAREIERALRTSGEPRVDVIGHSLGGLVATYLLKRIDRGERIRSVITLGTPHRGSPVARLVASALARLSSSIAQMIPESELVQELAALDVPDRCQLVSIAADDDALVPTLYAELPTRPRQFNLRVPSGGHLGLLFSSEVHAAIRRTLEPARLARICAEPLRLVPSAARSGAVGMSHGARRVGGAGSRGNDAARRSPRVAEPALGLRV
ncbi:MAG: esterase/lipase family protein [bacterium]